MADYTMPKSNWIWIGDNYDKQDPVIVYFRKKINLENVPEHCNVQITADSRYRFFVNGISVCQGPLKGDRQIWYYDAVDLAPYLQSGENVLSAIVLRYPQLHANGNFSVYRTEKPCFYLNGDLTSEDGFFWHLADGIHVRKANPYFEPLCITEDAAGDGKLQGWQLASYDMNACGEGYWQAAVNYQMMDGFISPGCLRERTIPFLYETEKTFAEVMCVREGAHTKEDWAAWIAGAAITVAPHSREVVELHAGELTTGYLEYAFAGGQDAKISFTCAESYAHIDPAILAQYENLPQLAGMSRDQKINLIRMIAQPVKEDRLDWQGGEIFGEPDTYCVGGFGTEETPETYEPFWFRTFRFVKLVIETGDAPLTLKPLTYRETGYPLAVQTKVQTSDPSLAAIWDISERTLRRCMHETYEDCPYYEQLQYVMDTRFQILATYMTSADDRLARKCIEDFARSQRYDGLVEGAYPSYGSNAIVNFSIFYILMVADHYQFFGDRKFTKKFLPVLERITDFYHDRLTEKGLVRKTSEGGQDGYYWSFVDWVPAWERGVPSAIKYGDATLESLLYLLGLKTLAGLEANFAEEGYGALAAVHVAEAASLNGAIRANCLDAQGLLMDGPLDNREVFNEYSQHCQVIGTLADVFSPEEAKKAMQTALTDPSFHQCTVSWGFYLFRAIEKAGLYDQTESHWDLWRDMVAAHLTTCVESNGIHGRSDCHAWGALALYELPAVTLGVRPGKPGFEEILIKPEPGYMTEAEGDVITPKGLVHVAWKMADGKLDLTYRAPEGVPVRVE